MSFKSFLPAAVWQYVQPFPSFLVYSVFPKLVKGEDRIKPPKRIADGTPNLSNLLDIGDMKSPPQKHAIRTPFCNVRRKLGELGKNLRMTTTSGVK